MFLFLLTPLSFSFLYFHTSFVRLQHLLHTTSACTPFICSHLQNRISGSPDINVWTSYLLTCAICSIAHLVEKRSQKSTFCGTPSEEACIHTHTHIGECWTNSWVRRNIWGKHLSQSSNWIVPRWRCCESVMSLVNCAKLTISRKLLSSWRDFSLLGALVYHQF